MDSNQAGNKHGDNGLYVMGMSVKEEPEVATQCKKRGGDR